MRLTRMPRSTDRLKQTGNCTISQTRASSDVCTSVCPWPTYFSIREFSVAKALIRGIHSSCVFVPFQILILLFGLLSFCSYTFLSIWRRNDERDDEFLPYSWEDEIVYKTSFAICSFSLAVSVGAALLLPISTISNEVSPPKVYICNLYMASSVSGASPVPCIVVHEVVEQFTHQWDLESHFCAQQCLALHLPALRLPILRVGGITLLR